MSLFDRYDDGYDEGYKKGYAKGKEDYERPHGEWIGRRFYDMHCSVCGKETSDLDDRKTPFCMWCGADMREGEVK